MDLVPVVLRFVETRPRPGDAGAAMASGLVWHMQSTLDSWRRAQGELLAAAGFGPSECAYREVASGTHWRLRDYGGAGGFPLLVVAAPIKHPYLWDLTPAVSAVRNCLDHGLHVWLLEWIAPQEGDPPRGLDHYAHEAIAKCVGRMVDAEEGRRPALVGHSLGGTFAAIHAAAEPKSISGLALLGAPLCFANDSSRFRDAVVALAPERLAETSVVPGVVLSEFCALATPDIFVWARFADFALGLHDPRAIEMHMRVERWALDELPLSGRLVAEVLQWLYREDRFCRGCLEIAGRMVGPRQIEVPTLAVVTTSDDVVPLTSVVPFLDALASETVQLVEYPGEAGVGLQHLGILTGRQAHAAVWPRILAWIDALQ
jgi:polyhydroxyalkanoate synthase